MHVRAGVPTTVRQGANQRYERMLGLGDAVPERLQVVELGARLPSDSLCCQ